MTTNVMGLLTDPLGKPMADAEIRVTVVECRDSVKGAESAVLTGSDGSYDFMLLDGTFLIEVRQDDEFAEGMLVTTDVGTVSPINIGTLMADYGQNLQ